MFETGSDIFMTGNDIYGSGSKFGVTESKIFGTGSALNRKNHDFLKILTFLFFKVDFVLELGRNSKIGLCLAHYPCL